MSDWYKILKFGPVKMIEHENFTIVR